jgi:hypothetical protein
LFIVQREHRAAVGSVDGKTSWRKIPCSRSRQSREWQYQCGEATPGLEEPFVPACAKGVWSRARGQIIAALNQNGAFEFG